MNPRCIVAAIVLAIMAGLVVPAYAAEQIAAPREQDPSPANPVQQSYENGRIIVAVISDRHYGHHLGETIKLRVLISSHPGVRLNYEMVTRGIFQASGSDFELVSPPKVIEAMSNGRRLVVIDLAVRSWVIKQTLVFNADIGYSVELAADAKTPIWKVLTSPDFVVTTSNTSTESSNALIENDQTAQVPTVPPPAWPMRVFGAIAFLCFPALCAWVLFRRVFPTRVVPPNEVAWRTFDRVFAEARFGGFDTTQVQELAHSLRNFLEVESLSAAELRPALERFFAGRADAPALVAGAENILAQMDRVLYSRHTLTADECKQIQAEILVLVPRP